MPIARFMYFSILCCTVYDCSHHHSHLNEFIQRYIAISCYLRYTVLCIFVVCFKGWNRNQKLGTMFMFIYTNAQIHTYWGLYCTVVEVSMSHVRLPVCFALYTHTECVYVLCAVWLSDKQKSRFSFSEEISIRNNSAEKLSPSTYVSR